MTTPSLPETSAPASSRAMRPAHSARRGYLFILGATLCWSTSGTFISVIRQTYGLSAWTVAFWRDSLTFAALLGIVALLGCSRLRMAWRDLIPIAAMGAISIGVFHVMWATVVTMIPVAVATVLNYTAPAFVVLFAWALWREAPTRRQTAALALALAGCVLVSGAYNVTRADLNWAGLLIGLSTGVTYGLFTIIGKNALRRYDSWTVLTYAFGFGALTIWVLRPSAPLQMLTCPPGAWAWIAALVLFSTVAGFSLYTSGLKHLSAGSASIAATLEPVMAAGVAFALLGEMIDPVQMAGGLLVIAAVILLTSRRARAAPAAT